MRIKIALTIFSLLPLQLLFGQSIQKSQIASEQDCANDRQIVAACFRVSDILIEPVMEQTACTDSPVAITRMSIRADGSYWISFRNLDKERKVTAVGYQVTIIDDQNRKILSRSLWGRPLNKPVEPGDEMDLENEEPHKRLEKIEMGRYLVQFNSVLFTDMSEWQLRTDCKVSSKTGLIRCIATE